MIWSMGSERVATRAILVFEGKVLLGKRGRGDGQGKYALIGGKPDEGETPEEAVVREVKEEVGLDFINPKLFMEETNDKTKPGEFWHTLYYLGEVLGVLGLKKDEVEEVICVGRADLPHTEIAYTHKEVLEKYFESLT